MSEFQIPPGRAQIFEFFAPPLGSALVRVNASAPVDVYVLDPDNAQRYSAGRMDVRALSSSLSLTTHSLHVGGLPQRWFVAVQSKQTTGPTWGGIHVAFPTGGIPGSFGPSGSSGPTMMGGGWPGWGGGRPF